MLEGLLRSNRETKLGMVLHALIPVLRRQKQEDLCEFQANHYTIYLETLSQNKRYVVLLMVNHVCNSSTLEAEAGQSQV